MPERPRGTSRERGGFGGDEPVLFASVGFTPHRWGGPTPYVRATGIPPGFGQ